MYRNLAILAFACAGPAALAQMFTNGDFETGNLTGWTITPTANGQTFVQDVIPFDIDFGGPLGVSQVGRFQVGQVVFTSGVPEGISVTQVLNLVAGTEYTISFNAAAYRETTTGNAQGGIFDLIVDGVSLANWAAGSTSSTTTNSSFLTANFTPGVNGAYTIGARIQRPFTPAGSLFQVVDNFSIVVPEPGTFVAIGLGLAGLLIARRRK